MNTKTVLRLSIFIRENMESILQGWEDFAKSIHPASHTVDILELRDHAEEMLDLIAEDLDTYQAEQQSIDKALGLAPRDESDSAAETHAATRLSAGFTIDQLVAEYRALRASVLRLWGEHLKASAAFEVEDMIRFNEAIDQSLAASVAHYSLMVRQSQNLFMAILGHDVRTPIGAINMGARVLLLDEALSNKHLKVASRILGSAERVEEMVGGLLDFAVSHLGTGIPITPSPIDLGICCENLVDETRTFHPERTILFEAAGDLDGAWDKARISQAFSNLMGNALQHGASDSPVTVTLASEGGQVVWTVHNEGNVIAPDVLRTIFDPVKRYAALPVGESTRHRNLGLGLYIAREIIHGHRGTIDVASTEADGTIFTVRLPRQPHLESRRAPKS